MNRVVVAVIVVLGLLAHPAPAHAGGPKTAPNVVITKGPWLQHVGPTSAIIRVEVDPPAAATVEVAGAPDAGAADAGSMRVLESTTVQALHSFTVSNLEPATHYTFTVRVRGAQKIGAVTTTPRDDSSVPFHFLVYGDNRDDGSAHATVVRAMISTPSDFLVHTGDFVERGGSARDWQTFFDIEAPLLRDHNIISAVGNHELTDGSGIDYVRYFGPVVTSTTPSTLSLDQLSGTYRFASTRFFLVNGMVDYRSGPTREWLDKALHDADDEPGLVWRIVVVHHGPRSSGPHGDNEHFRDADIPSVLRAHKIDLVLSGHDHLYERGLDSGLPYIVSGGGGAPLYRVKKAEASSRRYESVHHYVDAAVMADRIQFTAVRVDGSAIERCSLHKNVADWDCDPKVGNVPVSSPSLPADTPSSKSRCGCELVGATESGRWKSGIAVGLLVVVVARSRVRRRRRAAGLA